MPTIRSGDHGVTNIVWPRDIASEEDFFITQAIGSSTVIKEQIAAVSLTHAHNGWQQALRDVLSIISQTDLNSDAFKQVNSTVSVI